MSSRNRAPIPIGLREAVARQAVRRVHWGAVTGVAFSRCGRFLLSGAEDRMAALWDVAGGNRIRLIVGHRSIGMWHTDGRVHL